MSHRLSKEGVGQQCPKGKCGRNEGGQQEARGVGHLLLLVQQALRWPQDSAGLEGRCLKKIKCKIEVDEEDSWLY